MCVLIYNVLRGILKMANKRKHKLDRIIRYEYVRFEVFFLPRNFAIEQLKHINDLLMYKIYYYYDNDVITYNERIFMLKCNNCYYKYYKKRVGHTLLTYDFS